MGDFMNLWVLIGMLLVIAMLVFGKNPVREFQNQQKNLMEKYGSDPLTAQTNMYLEQKQKQAASGGMFDSVVGGGNDKKPVDQSANDMRAAIRNSATVVGNDPSLRPKGIYIAPPSLEVEGRGESDIIIKQSDPNGQGVGPNGQGNDTSASGYSSGGGGSYYPPIINNEPPVNKDTGSSLTGKEPKLRSGQPIAYDGTAVYSLDQQGNRSLLPDGDYILQDGRSFSVSGGRVVYK